MVNIGLSAGELLRGILSMRVWQFFNSWNFKIVCIGIVYTIIHLNCIYFILRRRNTEHFILFLAFLNFHKNMQIVKYRTL